jgi:hypothetical protein
VYRAVLSLAAAPLAALALAPPALAVPVCEVDGQHVNPSNGATTAGKTGLMRCRDGEGGPVVREQELQQGRFMGLVRQFADLRCADKPALGADFDDRAACGFARGTATVTLYSAKGAGQGRLRAERIYDARGRISRTRELDERVNVVRDDEVFEDGSRKAVGR